MPEPIVIDGVAYDADSICHCGGRLGETIWRGFAGDKRGVKTQWFCFKGGREDEAEHEFSPVVAVRPSDDPETRLLRARSSLTLRVVDYAANGGEQRFTIYQDARKALEAAVAVKVIEDLRARIDAMGGNQEMDDLLCETLDGLTGW